MGERRRLVMLDEVGSTNDEALALGRSGAPHGTAVAARNQTAGRGRRGHVWESPRGNLYLSVVLRPAVGPARLPGLAAACGLGALSVSNEAQLKWPNDLMARGRKLAGILVEAARQRRRGVRCLRDRREPGDRTARGRRNLPGGAGGRAALLGRCQIAALRHRRARGRLGRRPRGPTARRHPRRLSRPSCLAGRAGPRTCRRGWRRADARDVRGGRLLGASRR